MLSACGNPEKRSACVGARSLPALYHLVFFSDQVYGFDMVIRTSGEGSSVSYLATLQAGHKAWQEVMGDEVCLHNVIELIQVVPVMGLPIPANEFLVVFG